MSNDKYPSPSDLVSVSEAAEFLCRRLEEFESELEDNEARRQYYGHVHPAFARLVGAMTDHQNPRSKTKVNGRWRVFEAIEHGWWGIELEDAGNDDDPILSPVKMGSYRLEALVDAHNASLLTMATEGD